MTKYTDERAISELKRQIDEIDNVRKKPRMSPKFKSWQNTTSDLLSQVFGRKAKQVRDFASIQYTLAAFSNQTPESKFDEVFHQGLKKAAIVLSSLVKDIQDNGVGRDEPVKHQEAVVREPVIKKEVTTPAVVESTPAKVVPAVSEPAPRMLRTAGNSNKIFVVYADQGSIKRDLTDFLARIGIMPVLIEGKPGQLTTLLDQLHEHGDVSYAVVLLDPAQSQITDDVVFELGVLVGCLGPYRICGLLREKLAILANYSGISYVTYDPAGAWKFMMIKHLKTVGYDVDANLAL